jgi:hypothetical protein
VAVPVVDDPPEPPPRRGRRRPPSAGGAARARRRGRAGGPDAGVADRVARRARSARAVADQLRVPAARDGAVGRGVLGVRRRRGRRARAHGRGRSARDRAAAVRPGSGAPGGLTRRRDGTGGCGRPGARSGVPGAPPLAPPPLAPPSGAADAPRGAGRASRRDLAARCRPGVAARGDGRGRATAGAASGAPPYTGTGSVPRHVGAGARPPARLPCPRTAGGSRWGSTTRSRARRCSASGRSSST